MTNQMPPRDERQDELIASVVAFAAIGTILFLGLGRLGRQPLVSIAQRLEDAGSTGIADSSDEADSSLFGFLQEEDEADAALRRDRLEAAERETVVEAPTRERLDRDRTATAPVIVAPTPRAAAIADPEVDVETQGSALTDDPQAVEGTDAVEGEVDEAQVPVVPEPPEEPVVGEGPVALADVSSDYWAAPFINRLAEAGIVAGFNDDTFRPEEPVTRAQFAAQLAQAFDITLDGEPAGYSDVTADYWANESIQQVSDADFMSGYPDGSFAPGEQVSRLEVLIALVSGLSLEEPAAVQELLSFYVDQDQIPEWAEPKIATATDQSLVVNHPQPDSLNPNQPATRAEASAMIYQALVQQGRFDPVASQYVIDPGQ